MQERQLEKNEKRGESHFSFFAKNNKKAPPKRKSFCCEQFCQAEEKTMCSQQQRGQERKHPYAKEKESPNTQNCFWTSETRKPFLCANSTLICHMAEGIRWRDFHILRRNRFLRPRRLKMTPFIIIFKLSLICKKKKKIKKAPPKRSSFATGRPAWRENRYPSATLLTKGS